MTERDPWAVPPLPLDGFGLEEWQRVARPLADMGVTLPIDSIALACYASAFGQLRQALEDLERLPAGDDAIPVMVGAIADLRRELREAAKGFTISLPARALFEAGPKSEMDAIARRWSIL